MSCCLFTVGAVGRQGMHVVAPCGRALQADLARRRRALAVPAPARIALAPRSRAAMMGTSTAHPGLDGHIAAGPLVVGARSCSMCSPLSGVLFLGVPRWRSLSRAVERPQLHARRVRDREGLQLCPRRSYPHRRAGACARRTISRVHPAVSPSDGSFNGRGVALQLIDRCGRARSCGSTS